MPTKREFLKRKHKKDRWEQQVRKRIHHYKKNIKIKNKIKRKKEKKAGADVIMLNFDVEKNLYFVPCQARKKREFREPHLHSKGNKTCGQLPAKAESTASNIYHIRTHMYTQRGTQKTNKSPFRALRTKKKERKKEKETKERAFFF